MKYAFVGTSPHARGPPAVRKLVAHGAGNIPACAGTTPTPATPPLRRREHPRMRGDHAPSIAASSAALGTSPHARGPLSLPDLMRHILGNIPACAGTATSTSPRRTTRREHPRMRGDHLLRSSWESFRSGTSPHARGPRVHREAELRVDGNIPACAGTTSARGCTPTRRGEHPRMRGDHIGLGVLRALLRGTSPHARGPLGSYVRRGARRRNIPACAGTTPTVSCTSTISREHPRMRGDHLFQARQAATDVGTSPHARGPRVAVIITACVDGNIPACAGTTATFGFPSSTPREHPRMRGDHYEMKRSAGESMGTSPHARGPRIQVLDVVPAAGNIPACAGTTVRVVAHLVGRREHPRMRGDHASHSYSFGGDWGTSPHARGPQHPP